jgi:hypothetical protein
MEIFGERYLELVMSLATFFILEYFKRKSIKKDYLNREDAKIISVEEFRRINELNYHLYNFVYITGKIRRQNYFEKFYIKKYSSFKLADLNAEKISKNKMTINYESDNIKLHNARNYSKFLINSNPFFKYDDYLTIYGRIKRDKYTEKIYLEPIAITQGNKRSFLKKDFIIKAFNIFQTICLYNVVVNAINMMLITLKKVYFQKLPENDSEKCTKCKKYAKNIIFMNCNHFIYCYACFLKEKRFCKLCKRIAYDYILIKYK